VDPADVDILMGTFTKSFGGMGGYIAGDQSLIAHLRRASAGSIYHNSLSTVVCAQVRACVCAFCALRFVGLGVEVGSESTGSRF
jgi:serine palmitoyltransferase